jgi:uncharacterized repeat protein (TIGR01451 family)
MKISSGRKPWRRVWLGLGLSLIGILTIAALSGTGHFNPLGILRVLHVSQGVCSTNDSDSSAICDLGTIDSGKMAMIVLEFTPAFGGTFEDCAVVAAKEPDADPRNNRDCEITTARALADISVHKGSTIAPDKPLEVGDVIHYDVLVTNNGPSLATNVTLDDKLPLRVRVIGVVSTHGTCSALFLSVVCSLGSLASGETATVRIDAVPIVPGVLLNSACASANENDPAPGNNCDDDILEVVQPPPPALPDPAVDKVCEPSAITVGQAVRCTITVSNNGKGQATGVKVTDTTRDP